MDPAYTEIYTYGHTLSLHDALPISFVVAILSLARTEIATGNSSASAPMLFMKIETTAPVAHRNRTMAVSSRVREAMRLAKSSMIRVRESAATTSRISITVITAGLAKPEKTDWTGTTPAANPAARPHSATTSMRY